MTGYEAFEGYYDMLFGLEVQGPGLSELRALFKEAASAKGPVLELACGSGRILLPLAAGGIEIYGLDITLPMLKSLTAKAHQHKIEPKIFCADMRNFGLSKKFNLIIIPFNSLHHLLSSSDLEKTFQSVYSYLNPSGKLIFTIQNIEKEKDLTGRLHRVWLCSLRYDSRGDIRKRKFYSIIFRPFSIRLKGAVIRILKMFQIYVLRKGVGFSPNVRLILIELLFQYHPELKRVDQCYRVYDSQKPGGQVFQWSFSQFDTKTVLSALTNAGFNPIYRFGNYEYVPYEEGKSEYAVWISKRGK